GSDLSLPSLLQPRLMPSELSRPLYRRSSGWWILVQRYCCSWFWAANGCCCRGWLWRRFRGSGCFHFGCWWLRRSLSLALRGRSLNSTDLLPSPPNGLMPALVYWSHVERGVMLLSLPTISLVQ